jgi:hypothetical protein
LSPIESTFISSNKNEPIGRERKKRKKTAKEDDDEEKKK